MTSYNVRGDYERLYKYAHDYWEPFIANAQVYTLGASGYTWSDYEREQLIKEGREPLEFNIMRRPLQFFSGYLRDNINQVIYGPVEGSDQLTADQLTKLSYYIWDKGQGFPNFLDAADEAFKSGISLCGIHMDYSRDFVNGDAKFYKRTFNSFLLDPVFESIDLNDCSFAITRDLLGKEQVKQLIPFVDPSIIDNISTTFRDNKFIRYHPQFTTFSRDRNLIAYDQYYERTTRQREYLVDNTNTYYRDITDLDKEEKDKLKIGIKRFRDTRRDAEILQINPNDIPDVEIMTVERPYVKLHILLNGEPVYEGEDNTGIVETYPFVPLLGYFEPSLWMPSQRIQGLAAVNWNLQRQFNKRHMKIIDMMDSDISTGFKYLIGSVPDPTDMQQSGQNKIIGIDPENAPQGLDSVQQLNGGGANPALMQYQQILDQLSLTLANVNESALGIDEGGNSQISGKLAEVRISQGLRGNRKLFDNVETSQQTLGAILLKVIQANYSPGKVERIIGEEPTEQFYEREFEQYDAVVKQGVRSKSQKDAYYYELVNLKKDGVVDVPQAEIVRALSMAGLSDLEKSIEAQDQMRAAAAAQQQELGQAQLDVLIASKEEKTGLAQERRSRVISNLSLKDERESEAQQNIAQASLDRARAITEIASMNEDRLFRVIKLVEEMERQEAAGREAQKMQVTAEADSINAETEGSDEAEEIGAQQQQQNAMNQIMANINQGG